MVDRQDISSFIFFGFLPRVSLEAESWVCAKNNNLRSCFSGGEPPEESQLVSEGARIRAGSRPCDEIRLTNAMGGSVGKSVSLRV